MYSLGVSPSASYGLCVMTMVKGGSSAVTDVPPAVDAENGGGGGLVAV